MAVEIYAKKKVYSLYGIVNKMSQPKLMDEEENKAFLESLAERSGEELRENIKNGKIEVGE